MKLHALAAVLAIGFGAAIAPAYAQSEQTERTLKAPAKRMGDEGTLPTTSTMGEHVPTMGKGEPPNDPKKRMGDEGKLPATNTMSGAVPDMGQDKDQ